MRSWTIEIAADDERLLMAGSDDSLSYQGADLRSSQARGAIAEHRPGAFS